MFGKKVRYIPQRARSRKPSNRGRFIVPIAIFLAVAVFAAFLNWGPTAQTAPIITNLRAAVTANVLHAANTPIAAVETGVSLNSLIEMAVAYIESSESVQIRLNEQELSLESAFAFPWDTVSADEAARRLAEVLRFSVIVTEYAKYTVRPGDTFGNIAEQHNMTIAELFEANPDLTGASILRVGDVLNVIPNS